MSANPKSLSRKAGAAEKPIRLGLFITLLSLLILLVVMAVVWAAPRMIGDLFISLAGGRDVVAGRLGKPDTWSFATSGRVWLNQNWGSCLLFYGVEHFFGFEALLWLKAILIGLVGLVTALLARSRKVPWAMALLATAFMMAAARSFIDLRSNLMTLIFAPLVLWMLYLSYERPVCIWWAAGLTGIWANLHGGFIFGLGMIFLWTVCMVIPEVWAGGVAGLKRYRHTLAALAAAVLLAAFANPFGPVNLVHPLVMLTQSAWLNVAEWQPIWSRVHFGSIWEFVIVTILTVSLSLWRWKTTAQTADSPAQAGAKPHFSRLIIFEVLLFVMVTCMAVVSRRFIPMALLLTVPVLAKQVWWLSSFMRSRLIIAVFALMILIMAFGQFSYNRSFYDPNNQLGHRGTFFEQMNLLHKYYPVRLARFINENRISGNIISNWEWEGYLRWNCPQLKIFIGGRAQQIYSVKEFKTHEAIITGESPAVILKRLKVHYIVSSYDTRYLNLINRLVTGGKWVYIYNDNRSCLLADPDWAPAKRLMEQLLQDRLIFHNQAHALLSRASCMLSPAADQDHYRAFELLKECVTIKPMSKAYMALSDFIFADTKLAGKAVDFLELELSRLHRMSLDNPDGEELLTCRFTILTNLIQYYVNNNMQQQAAGAREVLREARRDYALMRVKWGTQ